MQGIYKIINTITGDTYIGSSVNIKIRWANHKCPSTWNRYPNSPLYADMRLYGREAFILEIVEEVADRNELYNREQYWIDNTNPTYNQVAATTGMSKKQYMKEYSKQYCQSDKYKEYNKQYRHSDKYKEYCKEHHKEYRNQLCNYNGEILTLNALSKRLRRKGIEHPTVEAKKYLI